MKTGSSMLAISLRSSAMPTSSETTLLLAERTSCLTSGPWTTMSERCPPFLVRSGTIMLEHQRATANDDHAVDVVFIPLSCSIRAQRGCGSIPAFAGVSVCQLSAVTSGTSQAGCSFESVWDRAGISHAVTITATATSSRPSFYPPRNSRLCLNGRFRYPICESSYSQSLVCRFVSFGFPERLARVHSCLSANADGEPHRDGEALRSVWGPPRRSDD